MGAECGKSDHLQSEPPSKCLHLMCTLIRLNISAEIFQSETKYVSLYILTMIEVVRSLRQS